MEIIPQPNSVSRLANHHFVGRVHGAVSRSRTCTGERERGQANGEIAVLSLGPAADVWRGKCDPGDDSASLSGSLRATRLLCR